MALLIVLQAVCSDDSPMYIDKKIIRCLVQRLYVKFFRKSYEKKPKYNITVEPEEAMAFYMYFINHRYPITSMEGNTIDQLKNLIHQKYV